MKVAIYLRISSEDGDLKDTGKAESESISNQRGLLLNFISNHSEFSGWEVSEFCDDGWSGKNFERPDFLRMMEQIKQGQIDCVLVKDLSRFGRDYLVVGNYISRVFPFLGAGSLPSTTVLTVPDRRTLTALIPHSKRLSMTCTAGSFPGKSKTPSGCGQKKACFSAHSHRMAM